MSKRYFYTSMTRISDLNTDSFEVKPLSKQQWATGDYVVGEICLPPGQSGFVELSTGRMADVLTGDQVIGALGVRCATLEAVGSWQDIGEDGRMEALTEGGLFGKATSVSFLLDNLPPMIYQGHIWRNHEKVTMKDFIQPSSTFSYSIPTLIMIGTSMSSGKTTTARIIIRGLKKAGFKVIGAKLAGAGQYHDILAMYDAGADEIFDFVDIGLPSTIMSPEAYRLSVRQLLSRIASSQPDIVVAEIGASPFEPYNGKIALEELKHQIFFTVLCASDPYAAVGATQSFELQPNVISGIVTDTTAGIELVEKVTGIKAISLSQPHSQEHLSEIIQNALLTR